MSDARTDSSTAHRCRQNVPSANSSHVHSATAYRPSGLSVTVSVRWSLTVARTSSPASGSTRVTRSDSSRARPRIRASL